VQKHLRWSVIDLVCVQGFHHADVIRHGAEVRQDFRKLLYKFLRKGCRAPHGD
jgi:hypothetical protein